MADSSSGSKLNDDSKRKYGHSPLMRVEKQMRNSDGSSYQTITPESLNQRKIVFQTSNSLFKHAPNRVNHVQASHSSKSKPIPPITNHSFVVNTVGSMKMGERPTLLAEPSVPYTPNSEESAPIAKRRRLLSDSQTLRKRIFRPSRPLKISDKVNSDIWQTILGYCEPKLLVEAKTINKEFRQLLLDRTAIWRESRQNYFGRDMPECPTGLTEQQYIDLLVGRGCQNRCCPKEHTAGVYWTFQARLCAECFKQKTMRADELPHHRKHLLPQTASQESEGRPLWELLPLARSDGRRYMRPRSVDISANGWASAHSLRQYVFLKSSYVKLEKQYLDLLQTGPTPDKLDKWMDEEHNKTMEFMIEVANLETWYKRQRLSDTDLQNMRIDFFQARAAQLSPPMSPSVLSRMAAFHRILKVQTPPTERSWKTLKAKILPYRLHAEIVEQFKLDMVRSSDRSASAPPAIKLFRRLHEHRSSRKGEKRSLKPEQDFVLKLAKREFARCLESKVADADLLLLCLKNVFDTYGELSDPPEGLNYDGTTGPYRLSMDDARMIVEEVMEKQISKTSPRGGAVFQSLRCRGCRRTDFARYWSFVGAFAHILNVHATVVGHGLEFWQFAVPYARDYETRSVGWDDDLGLPSFPWYTVAWPRCLPLVPGHQETATLDSWHPATSMPFVEQHQPPTTSAFDGRFPTATEIPRDDFVGNIVRAAEILNGVWLDSLSQMKIVLKYALDLYSQVHMTEPPISMFSRCFEPLRNANPTIDLRFRCAVCVGGGKVYRTARQVKYKVGIEGLLTHWEEKHADNGASWSQSLMQLPSETEVTEQLLEADQKLQQEREAARERADKLPENVRKRPKLKGNVVMNARSAGEVFDELFVRVDRFPRPGDNMAEEGMEMRHQWHDVHK